MLMEGTILRDTVSRNLSNKLGCSLELLKEGTKVTLVDMEKKDDGTWYYDKKGWIRGRDIHIDRDIEFMFKASSMGLMDLQLFSSLGNIAKGFSTITNNSIVSSGRSYPGLIACDGGGFTASNTNPIFGGRETKTDPFAGMTAKGALGSLGISTSSSSIFGKVLSSTSLSSLLSGGISGLIGSLMDSVFESIFSRLKFVVGFDVLSVLDSIYSPFGDINASAPYDGLLNPYEGGSAGNTISPYNKWEAQMDAYFRYLGCNGQMETKVFDNLTWEQDASYYTGTYTSTPIAADVEFHNQLYNADYSEFEESLDAVRDSLNLKISRLDWFVNFNRYRLTHPDYHLTNSRAYVFMTRPDLNIMDSYGSGMNDSIKNTSLAAFFYNEVLKHPNICLSLSKSFAGSHDFIPFISNTVRSLDIQDVSLKTLEHGETLTGWKIVYGRHGIDSKTAGTFNMNFIDDNLLSNFNLHNIWVTYIEGVSRGIIDPKSDYIRNGIIDYASSLYYILTDATGENIIFWSKYYGVIPTTVPSSTFSFNEGTIIHAPEESIQYAYCLKEDMNPLALAEFNNNSQTGFSYVPIYNENTFRCNGTIVGPPFIDTEDSGVTYKLRFRQKEN